MLMSLKFFFVYSLDSVDSITLMTELHPTVQVQTKHSEINIKHNLLLLLIANLRKGGSIILETSINQIKGN